MLINPFLVSCCSSSTKILFSHSGLINHSNCFSKRWPTYLKLKGLFPQLSHESTNTCYFNYYIHDGVMPISQVSPPRLIFPSICFITKTRFPLAIAIQTLKTWSKYSAIQIQSRKSVVITLLSFLLAFSLSRDFKWLLKVLAFLVVKLHENCFLIV